MTTSEDARRVVADIEAKSATISAREIQLANKGRALSFDAHQGDEDAKRALTKIDEQELKLRQEQRHLRDALDEAKRRFSEAERAEAMAEQRANAEAAARLADELAAFGRQADATADAFRTALEGLARTTNALHALGFSSPTTEQLKVFGGLALATVVMGLPIKRAERDHLAPRERKTFAELADGWAAGVQNRASAFTNKAEAA